MIMATALCSNLLRGWIREHRASRWNLLLLPPPTLFLKINEGIEGLRNTISYINFLKSYIYVYYTNIK